jgi:hypothetical protein
MTWVSAGIAAVGIGSSLIGGKSAKKAAKEAGKATAENILETEKENQRRRTLDLEQKVGGIRAAVYASNLQMGGSSLKYKNAFESNYRSEMAWDKQKARMDAETAKKGGQLAGDAAMYSAFSSAIGFAGQGTGALMAHGSANASPTSSNPFYFGKQSGPG